MQHVRLSGVSCCDCHFGSQPRVYEAYFRTDFFPVRVISCTTRCFQPGDPLAQKIRWKLKKHESDKTQAAQAPRKKDDPVTDCGITVVYSSEKPVRELLPLSEEQRQDPQNFGVGIDFIVCDALFIYLARISPSRTLQTEDDSCAWYCSNVMYM